MIYLVLIFTQILFGANFVTSKYVLEHVNSWHFVFIRFLISGLTLFLIISLRKNLSLFLPSQKTLLWSIGLGILGFALSQTLFLQGLKMTTAANTSILSTTIPLLTYAVSLMRGKRILDLQSCLGFFIAFIGVLILKEVDKMSFENTSFIGDLVVFLACFSIASFISFSKDFFQHVSAMSGTAYLFTFGALFLAPFTMSRTSWEWTPLLESDPYFLFCFLFAVFGATLMTYLLSNWTLKRISSEYLSLYIFLQPLVASFLGWAFLGETLKWRMPISTIFILLGVIFVTLKETHERKPN